MFDGRPVKLGLTCLTLLAVVGCAAPEPKDYSAYRANLPSSILVLPPINNSVEVNAPYSYLSTVTEPLAEAGYYVFPVAVVDAYMKENGLPTPADMQAVPLDKLDEVFGPDAVMYVSLEEYGQEYNLISSDAVVKADAKLVDTDTGLTLWDGRIDAVEASNSNSGSLLADLIGAAVAQAVNTTTDRAHSVAIKANQGMIRGYNGLLLGPYHPGSEEDPRGRDDVVEETTAAQY